jgi:hypothetical protein
MKRILFAAAVWLLGCVGALAQQTGPIYCGAIAQNSAAIATATTTQVLPTPSGSAKAYLCGYSFAGGSTASGMTMQLVYGTQTTNPCDTNQKLITPIPIAVGASSVVQADSSFIFRGLIVPAGQQLCVITAGATVAGFYQVFYEQY